MKKRIMLDLETMGISCNAAIISIGACRFDETGIFEEFHGFANLKSSYERGFDVCPETILWWISQGEDAQSKLIQGQKEGVDILALLGDFSSWLDSISLGQKDDIEIWGNGAAFDNAILANSYRALDIPIPWHFWNDMCFRTIRSLFGNFKIPEIEMENYVKHDALCDAKYQALHLIAMNNVYNFL